MSDERVIDPVELSDALLRSALDCIICIDAEGKVREWNPASEQTFGFSRDEVLGRSLSELIVPSEHREGHERGMRHLQETGEGPVLGKRIEMPALTKSGERILVELAIAERRSAAGPFYTAYLRDITARARAAEELRAAQAEAEEANRAKARFLAVLSHEFRTPLNAILGMSEVLRTTTLGRHQFELVEGVETSAAALVELSKDILAQSRVEMAELELNLAPTDIGAEIVACAEALGIQADSRGLDLRFHVSPEVPALVEVDAQRLRQVITNLVGNAVKYTRRGAVDVHLTRASDAEDRCVLVLEVRDTGPGIAEDEQEKIFQRYFRGRAVSGIGGAGLGLNVARSLVERMGGALELESTPAVGSVFRLRLPVEVSSAEEAERWRPLEGSPRVIVLSSPKWAHTLARYLERWGASPEIVESGAALDAALQRGEAELVFEVSAQRSLDEFAAELRALGAGRLTRIHALVPFGRARTPDQVDTVMWKPLRPERLRAAFTAEPGLERAEPEPVAAPPARRAARVLLAEDNDDNRYLICAHLEAAGHEVTAVCDGQEAVEALEREAFDIVLMDLEMPRLGGIEATLRIRELELSERMERTPIVAVTAHALDSFRYRCLEAGMDHFVTKPIRGDELREVVARFADRRPTVLLADDFAPARLLFERALAQSGRYRRRVARDGDEAIRLAARGGLVAAVLDLEMPVVDGTQAALALRAAYPQLRLMAVTGHADDATRARCLAAGFDRVMVKPVSPARIVAQLDAWSGAPEIEDADEVEQIPAVVRDLVPAFLEDAAERLSAASDLRALERIGHNLKGTSGGYGLTVLGDLGGRLEAAARDGDEDAARALREACANAVEALASALQGAGTRSSSV